MEYHILIVGCLKDGGLLQECSLIFFHGSNLISPNEYFDHHPTQTNIIRQDEQMSCDEYRLVTIDDGHRLARDRSHVFKQENAIFNHKLNLN